VPQQSAAAPIGSTLLGNRGRKHRLTGAIQLPDSSEAPLSPSSGTAFRAARKRFRYE